MTIGTCHHTQLMFVFLVEMGFHHVGQAGVELLTSGDPPAPGFPSAGITGMSHCARPTQAIHHPPQPLKASESVEIVGMSHHAGSSLNFKFYKIF